MVTCLFCVTGRQRFWSSPYKQQKPSASQPWEGTNTAPLHSKIFSQLLPYFSKLFVLFKKQKVSPLMGEKNVHNSALSIQFQGPD